MVLIFRLSFCFCLEGRITLHNGILRRDVCCRLFKWIWMRSNGVWFRSKTVLWNEKESSTRNMHFQSESKLKQAQTNSFATYPSWNLQSSSIWYNNFLIVTMKKWWDTIFEKPTGVKMVESICYINLEAWKIEIRLMSSWKSSNRFWSVVASLTVLFLASNFTGILMLLKQMIKIECSIWQF